MSPTAQTSSTAQSPSPNTASKINGFCIIWNNDKSIKCKTFTFERRTACQKKILRFSFFLFLFLNIALTHKSNFQLQINSSHSPWIALSTSQLVKTCLRTPETLAGPASKKLQTEDDESRGRRLPLHPPTLDVTVSCATGHTRGTDFCLRATCIPASPRVVQEPPATLPCHKTENVNMLSMQRGARHQGIGADRQTDRRTRTHARTHARLSVKTHIVNTAAFLRAAQQTAPAIYSPPLPLPL